MQLPQFSKKDYAALLVIGVVLVALLAPRPHWRETTSQSCHLCGNRRVTIRDYRWWRLHDARIEAATMYPVPKGHVHDWWVYSFTGSMWANQAGSKGSLYRDGKLTWER